MFGISTKSNLFLFDSTTENFHEVKLLSAGKRQSCEHGVQEQPRFVSSLTVYSSPRALKVDHVCCTEQSTIFVDLEGQLWSFNSSALENKSEFVYATRIELNKCAYKVRQLVTGRSVRRDC